MQAISRPKAHNISKWKHARKVTPSVEEHTCSTKRKAGLARRVYVGEFTVCQVGSQRIFLLLRVRFGPPRFASRCRAWLGSRLRLRFTHKSRLLTLAGRCSLKRVKISVQFCVSSARQKTQKTRSRTGVTKSSRASFGHSHRGRRVDKKWYTKDEGTYRYRSPR